MHTLLDPLIRSGAMGAGAVLLARLLPFMDMDARKRTEALCPGGRLVLVGLYPYFMPGEGNIARYARGADYHGELTHRLRQATEALSCRFPEARFVPLTDTSPLPETAAAYLSGAGILGDNGLISLPQSGSYLFIGTLLTDLPVTPPEAATRQCSHCGACVRACPTGALSYEKGERRIDMEKCLSHLSQKKGSLSPEEEEALARSPLIWGCDRCTDACPQSRSAVETSIPAFRDNLILSLSEEELSALSGRAFRQIYGDRAFSWRGKAPLARNLSLKKTRRDG